MRAWIRRIVSSVGVAALLALPVVGACTEEQQRSARSGTPRGGRAPEGAPQGLPGGGSAQAGVQENAPTAQGRIASDESAEPGGMEAGGSEPGRGSQSEGTSGGSPDHGSTGGSTS